MDILGKPKVDSDTFFDANRSSIQNEFIKSAIASVLNECLEQFYVLKSINLRNALPSEKYAIEYKTLHERYMGVENHADSRIPSMSANYDKIAVDINKLINIIKETCTEISSLGTFSVLEERTNVIKQMNQDDKNLLKQKLFNEKKIIELEDRFEKDRLTNLCTIEETNEKIQKLRLELENAIVYGRHGTTYYDRWEKTRIEQNNITSKDREQHYNNIINETKEKIDLEFKCHMEFTKFMEEDRNDIIDNIAYWVKKYDEEIDKRESEIINMKSMLEEMTFTHDRVIKENEKRKKEIAEWKAYKKNQRREKARAKDIRWASLILQTWWRAIMTRKRIGPYKPKGKGKK